MVVFRGHGLFHSRSEGWRDMIYKIVKSIMNFFETLFSVVQYLWSFMLDHLWAFFFAIFSPVFGLFFAFFSMLKEWLFGVAFPDTIASDNPSQILTEFYEKYINIFFGDIGFFGDMLAHVLNALAFDQLVQALFTLVLPTLAGVLAYRIAKSFVPTVAGV